MGICAALLAAAECHTVPFGKPSEPSRCWAGSSTTQGPGPAWNTNKMFFKKKHWFIPKETVCANNWELQVKAASFPQVRANTDNTKIPSECSCVRKSVGLLFRPARFYQTNDHHSKVKIRPLTITVFGLRGYEWKHEADIWTFVLIT